jgi:eukaryotic-like serine/threonine-protein kinase
MTSRESSVPGAAPPPSPSFASCRESAERALERSDFTAALALADQALSAAESDAPIVSICAVRLIQSEAHRWLGEPARAEPYARAAVAELEIGTALWCAAAGELAMSLAPLGEYERLVTLSEALLGCWAGGASSPLVIASERVAVALTQRGLGARAEALYEKLASAPAEELTPIARARVHQALATRALLAGDDTGYLQGTAAAADAFTFARDLRSACSAHVAVGLARFNLGDHVAAERVLREALDLAQRVNLPTLVAVALVNLGPVLAQRGENAGALASVRDALAIYLAQGNKRMICAARSYLAMILTRAGEFEAAEREATLLIEELDPAPSYLANALTTLADIHLAQHRPDDALRHAERAFALLADVDIEVGDARVRLIHAEALHAAGALEAARRAIAEAQARLLARAAKISNPALRESFLGRVPENARTLAAARAWGA